MAGVSLVKSLCSLRYRNITQGGCTLFAQTLRNASELRDLAIERLSVSML